MYIMFDTTVFASDFHLKSSAFKKLLDSLDRLGIVIFLNPFVIDETVEKYREKLVEYNAKTKSFQNLVPEYCASINDDKIKDMVDAYRNFITYEAWEKVNMNVKVGGHSFNDLHYSTLFERCLKKKKPFSHDGRGLKDMVIWASLKESTRAYLRNGQIFAFITDNYKDFCVEKPTEHGWYQLHPDLLTEIIEDERLPNVKHDTVRVYRSISSFNSDILNEKSELFTDIINELNNERYRELVDYLTKEIEIIIELENDVDQINKVKLVGLNFIKPRIIFKNWTDSFENLAVIIDIKYTIKKGTNLLNEISVNEKEVVLYVNAKDRKFEGLNLSV